MRVVVVSQPFFVLCCHFLLFLQASSTVPPGGAPSRNTAVHAPHLQCLQCAIKTRERFGRRSRTGVFFTSHRLVTSKSVPKNHKKSLKMQKEAAEECFHEKNNNNDKRHCNAKDTPSCSFSRKSLQTWSNLQCSCNSWQLWKGANAPKPIEDSYKTEQH